MRESPDLEIKLSDNELFAEAKLNGIMPISPDYNISQKRNVYFFPTHTARVSLSRGHYSRRICRTTGHRS